MEFPEVFIDFIQDTFGLEWVDYCNQQCYDEFCKLKLCAG